MEYFKKGTEIHPRIPQPRIYPFHKDLFYSHGMHSEVFALHGFENEGKALSSM